MKSDIDRWYLHHILEEGVIFLWNSAQQSSSINMDKSMEILKVGDIVAMEHDSSMSPETSFSSIR
jgi:hypothetical protein